MDGFWTTWTRVRGAAPSLPAQGELCCCRACLYWILAIRRGDVCLSVLPDCAWCLQARMISDVGMYLIDSRLTQDYD